MAARLHEADGLEGPRAEDVRERAGRELNLSLSRTRLALADASDGLRRQARAARTEALPASRRRAAVARSTSTRQVPALASGPSTAPARPAVASAAPRR
ncbi:hypothetical protein [Kitasatospora griseola]|uniref:hypothetical protein n=1 Tax=Kitasatospora griseola TaxID=2064 RepID=UPI00343FE1F6